MISIQTNMMLHYSSLQYDQFCQNSEHYLYTGISLANFLIPNINLNNSVVINLTDFSCIYIPEITYYIDSANLTFDLNGNIYFGGEKTEFGNNAYNTVVNLWAQINFWDYSLVTSISPNVTLIFPKLEGLSSEFSPIWNWLKGKDTFLFFGGLVRWDAWNLNDSRGRDIFFHPFQSSISQ